MQTINEKGLIEFRERVNAARTTHQRAWRFLDRILPAPGERGRYAGRKAIATIPDIAYEMGISRQALHSYIKRRSMGVQTMDRVVQAAVTVARRNMRRRKRAA